MSNRVSELLPEDIGRYMPVQEAGPERERLVYEILGAYLDNVVWERNLTATPQRLKVMTERGTFAVRLGGLLCADIEVIE